jgi:hypothetical protein
MLIESACSQIWGISIAEALAGSIWPDYEDKAPIMKRVLYEMPKFDQR